MTPCKLKFIEIRTDIDDVTRGDSVNFPLTFTEKATGDPLVITGAIVYLTIRNKKTLISKDDSDAIFQKIQTSHSEPLNGKTNVEITPTDWDSINIPDDDWVDYEYVQYKYGISITMPSGTKVTVQSGDILIANDVTKS
ncbi:MAG: hypothetical protein GY870_16245 [archaeon]|nr:hypothetical protein [archaeon]